MKIRYRNTKGECSEVWAADRFYGKVDYCVFFKRAGLVGWCWTCFLSKDAGFGHFETRDAAAQALTTVRPRAKLRPWR